MMNKNQGDNPTNIAKYFSDIQARYGYKFDFTLESLEKEVDRFLEQNSRLSIYLQTIISSLLTAYVGETICRLYNGKWCGQYRGVLNTTGSNFYLSWIEIKEQRYSPSHFIEYYLTNGKDNEGSFFDFLQKQIISWNE